MAEGLQKILVVEDDLDVAEMLGAYFHTQGYEVDLVHRGEDGIRSCFNSRPNIIILDIRLPDIDGYEVARRLRDNRRTADIPIIFLTEKHERSDRLRGLEIGADDYIPKPFDVQELRLRVRNAIRRAEQDTLTHPITGLPDGKLVDERLAETIGKNDWSMLVIGLEYLDSFRETYGFVASDDVLRAVSMMVSNVKKENEDSKDFLGHLSPTDFVLITVPERAEDLKNRLSSRLESSLDYFYPIKDREQMTGMNSRLMFRIGILQNNEKKFSSLDELKLALIRKKH
jgi:DNA-binding response OmpR family regulator